MANRADTPAAAVDGARGAHEAREPGDDLHEVARQRPAGIVGHTVGGRQPGLLPDERELVLQRERVVGADLRAEPVLQRRDDAAAVGVVLRVGARHQEKIELEPQRVAADLDVAFLQHVQQRHLDPLGQVGQLVQAEDAPVGARNEPEVDSLWIAERAPGRDLDRVDIADQVADAGVGRGELLAVPLAPVPPDDVEILTALGGQPAAARAHRRVRMIVDLASGDGRGPFVEQAGERPDQPGLSLSAFAKQHDVMASEQGPLDVWQDGRVEPHDAGEAVLARCASARAGSAGSPL